MLCSSSAFPYLILETKDSFKIVVLSRLSLINKFRKLASASAGLEGKPVAVTADVVVRFVSIFE